MEETLRQINTRLYGPRYCGHCDKIVKVRTYQLQNTEFLKREGTKVTAGFIGSHVCDECLRPIKDQSK